MGGVGVVIKSKVPINGPHPIDTICHLYRHIFLPVRATHRVAPTILFVTQGLNGVEFGGLVGGVDPKDNPYKDCETEGNEYHQGGYKHWPVPQEGEELRTTYTQGKAYQPPYTAQDDGLY